MGKRESIDARVFPSNSHNLERIVKATDICVRKGLSPALSVCSSLPGQQEVKQRNAVLPVPPQWGRSSTKSLRVHQQDSETGTGLSWKKIENKIKLGLIRKANVCRDKATAGIVISQIVLIWANSASETVTVVFMLSSPSWPYLASLGPLNMGQTLITLHHRSRPHHCNHANLEFVHESDKEKRWLKYDFFPLV